MGPEAKFYNYFKKKTPEIIYTRIENTSSLGTPDALCYNENQFYFTLEFKVSRSKKLSFSPHQIAWHIMRILELAARGLELEACCLGLEACRLRLVA